MSGRQTERPDQGALDLHGWDQPPRHPAGPTASPVLVTDGFEGPLDWLLGMARHRRIDLARLPIADLIGSFEDALANALGGGDTEPLLLVRWGEWLVMAAELTLLRSRLLMPGEGAEVDAARREAERLRRDLLNRVETARAADWLDGRSRSGLDVFPRGQTDDVGTGQRKRTGDVTALLRACLAAIRLPAEAGTPFEVPGPPAWGVLDAVGRIRAMLQTVGEDQGQVLEGFLPPIPPDAPGRGQRCRSAVSATFLATLELARDGEVVLMQDHAWNAIRVRRSATGTAGPC